MSGTISLVLQYAFMAGTGTSLPVPFLQLSCIIQKNLPTVHSFYALHIKTKNKHIVDTYLKPDIHSPKSKAQKGTSKVNNNNICFLEVCNKTEAKTRQKSSPQCNFIMFNNCWRKSIALIIFIYLSVTYVHHDDHWKKQQFKK